MGPQTETKHRSTGHGRVLQRLIHRQRPDLILKRHIRAIGRPRLSRAVDHDLDSRSTIVIHDGQVSGSKREGASQARRGLLGAASWQMRQASMACFRGTLFESRGGWDNRRRKELTMSVFVHHFIRCILLPRQTAWAAIAVVRALKKKSKPPRSIHLCPLCAIWRIKKFLVTWSPFCFSHPQDVCHWISDFLHGLRQSAARIHWRCKCDSALHGLRDSQ